MWKSGSKTWAQVSCSISSQWHLVRMLQLHSVLVAHRLTNQAECSPASRGLFLAAGICGKGRHLTQARSMSSTFSRILEHASHSEFSSAAARCACP